MTMQKFHMMNMKLSLDKKFKNILNKAKRNNSSAKNIVIGCYAQLKPC